MQFPAFLFGSEEEVIGRAESDADTWAEAWRQTGALPTWALRTIEPGELVLLYQSLDPFTPRWRLLGAGIAISATARKLAEPERSAFEAFVSTTPWGALAECERLLPPNTVETVTRRARALFAMWEPLSTLRYIGRLRKMPAVVQFPALNQDSISFDELVAELFDGPLAVWGPQLGSTRKRLESALDAMSGASHDEASRSRARTCARKEHTRPTPPRSRRGSTPCRPPSAPS
jgi:hypothetical protein